MNNIQNVFPRRRRYSARPYSFLRRRPRSFSTFIRLLTHRYCGDADWRRFAVGGPVVSDLSNFSILGKRDLPAVPPFAANDGHVGVRTAWDCRGRELNIAEFAADIERPGEGAASRVLRGVVDVHADVPVRGNLGVGALLIATITMMR